MMRKFSLGQIPSFGNGIMRLDMCAIYDVPLTPKRHVINSQYHLVMVTSISLSLCIAAVVTTLLPHLDALDLHLSSVLPCRVPLVLCVPKVLLCGGAIVQPRLARATVLEPTIL
jgi:hypothetical protein